jgi:hypothetical protein
MKKYLALALLIPVVILAAVGDIPFMQEAVDGSYSEKKLPTDASTFQSGLGLVPGTNVQAWDADLDDLADGTLTGNKVQAASATDQGSVTTGTQTFAGAKTFSNNLSIAPGAAGSLYLGNGSSIYGDVNGGYSFTDGGVDRLVIDGTNGKLAAAGASYASGNSLLNVTGMDARYANIGRTIAAGSGLGGGGTLASDRSIYLNSASIASLALANTAVQPGALGGAALLNVGTTTGTVAAGDDSRIVAGGTALQPAGSGASLTGLTWSQIGSVSDVATLSGTQAFTGAKSASAQPGQNGVAGTPAAAELLTVGSGQRIIDVIFNQTHTGNTSSTKVGTLTVPAGSVRVGSLLLVRYFGGVRTAADTSTKSHSGALINASGSNTIGAAVTSTGHRRRSWSRMLYISGANEISTYWADSVAYPLEGDAGGSPVFSVLSSGITISSGFTIDFYVTLGNAGDLAGVTVAFVEILKY